MGLPTWYLKHMQTSLFKEEASSFYLDRHNTKVIVGQFFEYITEWVLLDSVRGSPGSVLEPDFILWGKNKRKNDILIEVKSTKDKSPIIDLKQFKNYQKIADSEFPYTKASVFYFIYFYDTEKALHRSGDLRTLLTDTLPNGIESCVIIPISLMQKYINGSSYSYGKWGWGDRTDYARASNSISTLLMTARKQQVIDAFKLCGAPNFHNKYTMSNGFLKKIKVLGVDVPPIRYLFIRERDSKITRGSILKH